MTVRDLISKLQEFDQSMEVVTDIHDGMKAEPILEDDISEVGIDKNYEWKEFGRKVVLIG